MFAVIETGGKQYLVRSGQKLKIEKIEGEAGAKTTFDKVLMVAKDDGTDVKIGAPYLEGASIEATIKEQSRDKKLRVVKFHRKVRFKRTYGHRQHHTTVEIGAVA